ncbi:abc multidrug transporter [Pseudozyma flocculosa PF-1]|uniref:Related to ABC transporter n=1 Tax=Pseudozyma flocculosa TaxID=84751 RepID=A0A5C3ETW5_9BASI|nr:abc multidrug transporter [Pseudozyma flocculosa PF-1]EPQ31809.1 abc multidrug transporter [Pseudozyma flocculosa PF-1]SPO35300.1 related to ABC transporter [Pseudozyma flocculosa]
MTLTGKVSGVRPDTSSSAATGTTAATDRSDASKSCAVSIVSDDGPEGPPSATRGEQAETTPAATSSPVSSKASFSQIFAFADGRLALLNIIGLLAAAAAGVAQPLMTIFIGRISTSFLRYSNAFFDHDLDIFHVAQKQLYHDIRQDSLILVYLGIAIFAASYIYMAAWSYTSEKICCRIREAYLRSTLQQEIAYFDEYGPGQLASHIRSDVHTIQSAINEKMPMTLMYVSTFVASVAVAFSQSWKLSLVLLPIAPTILVAGGVMSVLTKAAKQTELASTSKGANRAEEACRSIRTVKAFGKEAAMLEQYDRCNEETTLQGAKIGKLQGIGVGSLMWTIYSGYALAFWYGSKLIGQGELSPGRIISVIFSNFIGAFAIATIFPNLEYFSAALAAAGPVLAAIHRKPRLSEAGSDDGLEPKSVAGRVELEGVSFAYPSRPDVSILRSLSLSFEDGKTTALVGASGCGKSTVIALLERFYEPTAGRVTLDGIDIRHLRLSWLRDQVGLVSQEPTLFATTIRANIEFGLTKCDYNDRLTDDERFHLVVEASKKANAHDFIMALPDGYATLVGDNGSLLSGGQKQRIAIARALVKDPRVLLLDEVTSALDTASEAVVQAALDAARFGRTTIVVSHRLSTVKNADRIVVLGRDGVIEQGSHDELMSKAGGAYATMVGQQALSKPVPVEADPDSVQSVVDGRTSLQAPLKTALGTFSLGRIAASFELPRMSDFVQNGRPSISVLRRKSSGGEVPTVYEDDDEDQESSKSRRESKPGLRALAGLVLRGERNKRLHLEFLVGLVAASVIGAIYPIYSIVFGIAMDNFTQCNDAGPCFAPIRDNMLHQGRINAGAFFVIACGAAVISFLQVSTLTRAGSSVVQRVRHLMFERYLRSDVAFFDHPDHSGGALSSRLTDNAQKIYGALGPTLGVVVQCTTTMVVGYVVALSYGWRLALVVIAVSPLTLSAGLLRLRIIAHKDEKTRTVHETATRHASEAVGAIRTVAAYNLEHACLDLYRQHLDGPASTLVNSILRSSILFALSQSITLFAIAIAFYYGGKLLADGHLTSKSFFTVLMSVVYGSVQAGNVFNYTADLSGAYAAARATMELMETDPTIERDTERGKELSDVQGGLQLRNVYFTYPSRPNAPILRGISLDFEPGTFCALVGSSGCGKSTILQLLERFHDPTGGQILLDGCDTRSVNLASLRRHISMVPQDAVLYDGTIGWNIALGSVDDPSSVTMPAIRRAADIAQLTAFIDSLPDGFNTHVSGRGVQLSGGQKQRIAIARAMVREPKILLLDEATSALDPIGEREVQAALEKASEGRTTIAVAHRLSTIAKADTIYVLKDGDVAEKGDAKTLTDRGGIYAEMVRVQNVA